MEVLPEATNSVSTKPPNALREVARIDPAPSTFVAVKVAVVAADYSNAAYAFRSSVRGCSVRIEEPRAWPHDG